MKQKTLAIGIVVWLLPATAVEAAELRFNCVSNAMGELKFASADGIKWRGPDKDAFNGVMTGSGKKFTGKVAMTDMSGYSRGELSAVYRRVDTRGARLEFDDMPADTPTVVFDDNNESPDAASAMSIMIGPDRMWLIKFKCTMTCNGTQISPRRQCN